MQFIPVKDYPFYLACDDGFLLNTQTGNILNGRTSKTTGYVDVCIVDEEGNHRTLSLHRVIAEAFCERPEGANEVNHINGNKTDNRAENLEWVTREENLRHAYENGLTPYNTVPRCVIATNMETGETMEFQSIYKAARFFNISQGNICMCCKGFRPYANGYYWEYK